MKWTSEDIKMIEKFIDIKNRGFYVDGGQLTDVYNRVLEKNVPITNCGSCLRQRVNELEQALNKFKESMDVSGYTKSEEYINEVNAITNELSDAEKMKERMMKVRAAKKKK